MKKNIMRIMAGFLGGIYMTCAVSGAYVTAYATALPVAYTAWEVIQAILFTLGISVVFTDDVADSDLANEVAQELVDTYNMWLYDLTYDLPEGYTTEDFVLDLADMGTWARDGIVTIGETTWQGLRAWASDIVSKSYVTAGSFTLNRMADVCGITDFGSYTSRMTTAINTCLSSGHIYAVANSSHTYFEFFSLTDTDGYGTWTTSYGSTAFGNLTTGNIPTSNLVGSTYSRFRIKDGTLTSVNIMQNTGDSVPVWLVGGSPGDVFAIYDGDIVSGASDIPVYDSDSLAYDVVGLTNIDGVYCNDAYDVVTWGRTWDGTDVAGDVVISIPQEGAIEGAIAGDIPYEDVYEQVGVYPVDTTADSVIDGTMTIGDAIAATVEPEASTGGGESTSETDVVMTFDLTGVFPFCIPFDLIDFISILSADPVAPYFEIPIKYPTLDGMATYMVEIDLSQFDSVASLVRKMECIVFIVGLLMITRDNMIKG